MSRELFCQTWLRTSAALVGLLASCGFQLSGRLLRSDGFLSALLAGSYFRSFRLFLLRCFGLSKSFGSLCGFDALGSLVSPRALGCLAGLVDFGAFRSFASLDTFTGLETLLGLASFDGFGALESFCGFSSFGGFSSGLSSFARLSSFACLGCLEALRSLASFGRFGIRLASFGLGTFGGFASFDTLNPSLAGLAPFGSSGARLVDFEALRSPASLETFPNRLEFGAPGSLPALNRLGSLAMVFDSRLLQLGYAFGDTCFGGWSLGHWCFFRSASDETETAISLAIAGSG